MKLSESQTYAVVFAFLAALPNMAVAQGDSVTRNGAIVDVAPGSLNRLRLVEAGPNQVAGEYPAEELRLNRHGRERIAFSIDSEGRLTEPMGRDGAFYDAALSMLSALRFSHIEGSLPEPVNRYVAVVTFRTPPCLPAVSGGLIDIVFTVCASRDTNATLQWAEPWPSRPVYPAALNRTPDAVAKLQFLGVWQPGRAYFGTDPWTVGVVEIDRDTIKDVAGRTLASYSVVAHEEFAAVLRVTGTDGNVRYWRFDALSYAGCLTAADGFDCAEPYDYKRIDRSTYVTVDGALSLSSRREEWMAYFPFRSLNSLDEREQPTP